MLRVITLTSSIFALIFAAGCELPIVGGGSSPEGTWTKCEDQDTGSIDHNLVFAEGKFTYKLTPYAEADCDGEASDEIELKGTWTEGEDSADVEGAKELDLKFTDVDEDAAEGMGIQDGDTIYTIFKIEDDKLQLGETDGSNDGTSAAKRESKLGSEKFTKKAE